MCLKLKRAERAKNAKIEFAIDNNPCKMFDTSEFTHAFFEKSSKEWMKGKKRQGHMIYYICEAIQKNGKRCCRKVHDGQLCTQHSKTNKKLITGNAIRAA
jgi:hypothetical protein